MAGNGRQPDSVYRRRGRKERKRADEGLGHIEGDKIVDATSPVITTQCLRVPVSDGHTAAVFVSFENKPSIDEIKQAWKDFFPVSRRRLTCRPHRSSS